MRQFEKFDYAQTDINRVINSLNDAINICYNAKSVDNNVPDTYNESYPFATGYSRSAMKSAVESLQGIITYLGEE